MYTLFRLEMYLWGTKESRVNFSFSGVESKGLRHQTKHILTQKVFINQRRIFLKGKFNNYDKHSVVQQP